MFTDGDKDDLMIGRQLTVYRDKTGAPPSPGVISTLEQIECQIREKLNELNSVIKSLTSQQVYDTLPATIEKGSLSDNNGELWKRVPDLDVRHFWKKAEDDDCGNADDTMIISPAWYQKNGTPTCECGQNMVYSHTEVWTKQG